MTSLTRWCAAAVAEQLHHLHIRGPAPRPSCNTTPNMRMCARGGLQMQYDDVPRRITTTAAAAVAERDGNGNGPEDIRLFTSFYVNNILELDMLSIVRCFRKANAVCHWGAEVASDRDARLHYIAWRARCPAAAAARRARWAG